jgi:serine/threonine protein kinase
MSQFRIEEKISESGTTSVYRAFQEALERPVLLKVLHQHLANDRVVRERFIREAKACAHLRSEHIVQVYDLTEYNGCPAIVMEYVHGRSLKEVIAGSLPDRNQLAIKTAVGILQALSLAHRRGIVHRDIKPGNILVADDGTVKLTDFGLASVAHSTTVTIEGTVLGTPAYMAPEQVRGESADARTDFFSLGVTLVEVFTGQRIFEGSTYSECVKKIVEFRTNHLDVLMEAVPPQHVAFLKRLMEPDPNARYQSAGDALKDLGEGEEGQSDNGQRSPKKMLVPVLSVAGVLAITGLLYFGIPGIRRVGVTDDSTSRQPAGDSAKDSLRNEKLSAANPAIAERKNDAVPSTKEARKPSGQRSSSAVAPGRDSVKIVLTSNPWAKVYVDGRLIGETPLAQPVYLVQGKHAVTFSNPAFDPILKSIDVQPGKDQVVSGDFLENAGFLLCTVKPWAEIYVDEQYKDTTPLNRPIILSAGSHRIRFHNTAFSDTMQIITIRPRDTLAIAVTLKALR